MLNKFPLWKNIMLMLVIALGIIYALPNLYGDVPAVQISGNNSQAKINEDFITKIKQTLSANNIQSERFQVRDNSLLILFGDTDTQFKARTVVTPLLGNNFTAALNLVPATPGWLRAIGANPVKLGLDLRGGIHFLLDVDVNGVVNKRVEGELKSITDAMRSQDIRYMSADSNQNNEIILVFRDMKTLQQAQNYLPNNFPDFQFTPSKTGYQLTLAPTTTFITSVQEYAISQTLMTLRNRINELGIAEPVIQQQGATRISVDLPGVQDSAQARQILGATATLEFHLVNTTADVNSVVATGVAPPGSTLYHMQDGTPIVLQTQSILSGSSITSASSSFGDDGKPIVPITLGGAGVAYFSQMTSDNIGQPLAIVYVETKPVETMVNGKPVSQYVKTQTVISAPIIQSALGNNFQITGINDVVEARNLALLLRAGAMPANVDIIAESTVGPSLGAQNIHMGVLSVEVAFILIAVFMALYYNLFGIFADLALTVNLILIVAILSILGATLTLPGIAGIVLTVGMAVDGNVLIFERIREELRLGTPIQTAINAGFERAFATIVDANVTTLIVAVILFAVGTGPVQGFAVTLIIGLLTSMFTAVTFTRGLVNLTYGGKPVKKLAIGMKS